jgi:endonuclease YncB( thermonuclease family)
MFGLLRLIFGVFVTRRPRGAGRPRDDHAAALPAIPPSLVLSGRCHVIDGDTIVIERTKIRLAGIDAPELHQPWGQKAKWTLVGICKGRIVTARLTGERSYDRLVATCHLPDGSDIGAELVRRGLALDLDAYSGGRYRHLELPGIRQRLEWARTKRVDARPQQLPAEPANRR